MKNICLITILSIFIISCNQSKETSSKEVSERNIKSETKKEVIKIDQSRVIQETSTEYRTTEVNSRLLQSPSSNNVLTRIPENTKLEIIQKKTVQQGMMKNNWYKVSYENKIGWISGFNMKEGEEVVITSVEEMKRNYESQIGLRPRNNILTGKIKIIDEWIQNNSIDSKSIKYEQWYECYVQNENWICRVEYNVKGSKMDKLFKVRNGVIIDVVDK